ncbi:unnamed protein product [marine sediment metagenome]|uniref:Uncharacterized protein n=1 Tax=marine sediment metagenome TaxID=412755 RepID=X1F3P0_9ZZZZ
MIRINLLKPGIAIYDDSDPGGIIDIRFETDLLIKPCLYEVFWDKEDFNNKIKDRRHEIGERRIETQ